MKNRILAELRQGGLSPEEAEAQLAAVVRAIRRVVRDDRVARVPNLGTFKLKHRASRTVRSIRSGEMVTTLDKDVLTFNPMRGLVL